MLELITTSFNLIEIHFRFINSKKNVPPTGLFYANSQKVEKGWNTLDLDHFCYNLAFLCFSPNFELFAKQVPVGGRFNVKIKSKNGGVY